MRRAALLSIVLLASVAGVALGDDYGQCSPYTHHPYYPSGWYRPSGPYWVRWWGLREPYTPPSGTNWIPNPMRCDLPLPHVPSPGCNAPTIRPYEPGCRPPLGGFTAPEHDVYVTTPATPYGSWQWSLNWLRCK